MWKIWKTHPYMQSARTSLVIRNRLTPQSAPTFTVWCNITRPSDKNLYPSNGPASGITFPLPPSPEPPLLHRCLRHCSIQQRKKHIIKWDFLISLKAFPITPSLVRVDGAREDHVQRGVVVSILFHHIHFIFPSMDYYTHADTLRHDGLAWR